MPRSRRSRLGLSTSEIFGTSPDQPKAPKAKEKAKAKAKPKAKPEVVKAPKKTPTAKKAAPAPKQTVVSPPSSQAIAVPEVITPLQEAGPIHAEAVSWKAGYLIGATLMRLLSIFRWRKRRKR